MMNYILFMSTSYIKDYFVYAAFLLVIVFFTSVSIHDLLSDLEDDQFADLSEYTMLISKWVKDAYFYNDEADYHDIVNHDHDADDTTIVITDLNGNIIAVNGSDVQNADLEYIIKALLNKPLPDFMMVQVSDVTSGKPMQIAIRYLENPPYYIIIAEPPYQRKDLVIPIIIFITAVSLIILLASLVLRSQIKRKRMDEEIKNTNLELAAIFNNSDVGIMQVDSSRSIKRVNRRYTSLLGYQTSEDLLNQPLSALHISDENYEDFGNFYDSVLNKIGSVHIEYEFKQIGGGTVWLSMTGSPVDNRIPANPSLGTIWTAVDITEKRRAEEKLIELATTDALTGLPNRRVFMEAGERELSIHKRHDRPLSILMIDMDHFKAINDTFGHSAGDKALVYFAETTSALLRTEDVIGRIGGEEFAVVLPDTKLDKAYSAAERIRKTIEQKHYDPESDIPAFTISIGAAEAGDADTIDEILQKTDEALYTAKNNGRNRVEIYKPSADKNTQ